MKKAKDGIPRHWKCPMTEEERKEEYDRIRHKYLHMSHLQFDAQFGISLDQLVRTFDPITQYRAIKEITGFGILRTSSYEESTTGSCKYPVWVCSSRYYSWLVVFGSSN